MCGVVSMAYAFTSHVCQASQCRQPLLYVLWLQDPYEALQLALEPDNIHPVDVALVNGEVFANLATAGEPTAWQCPSHALVMVCK